MDAADAPAWFFRDRHRDRSRGQPFIPGHRPDGRYCPDLHSQGRQIEVVGSRPPTLTSGI